MTGIALAGLAGLTAVVLTFVNFARLLTNLPATRSSVVSQVLAWAAGIAVVCLYAASQYGHTVVLDGVTLGGATWATKVLVGIALASAAGVVVQVVKAVDNTQSAAVPPLTIPRRRAVAPSPPPPEPAPGATRTRRRTT